MEFFSTGIDSVDKMGHLAITGDVKPRIWNKTIVNENGKPQRLAMDILAEIVYWYRPVEVRDERTGEVTGWRKKFSGDMLQKDYASFVENYGESEKTISRALAFLEDLGVIKRHRKSIRLKSGTIAHNVLFIELDTDRLYELTYPQKDEIEVSDKEKSLEEYEIVEDENDENPYKQGVSTERSNLSNYLDKNVQVLRQKCPSDKTNLSEDLDKNDGTNTYNTSKISSEISSVSLSYPRKTNLVSESDSDIDIDDITNRVQELMGYDSLLKDTGSCKDEDIGKAIEFNCILDEIRNILVYEVFAAPDDKQFNFGSKEQPDFKNNSIVKSVFIKHLSYPIVMSYIKQYLTKSTEVKRVTMYHIKSLYSQCLTQSSQYLSGGRNFYVR